MLQRKKIQSERSEVKYRATHCVTVRVLETGSLDQGSYSPLCHSACSFRALILLMTINKGRGSFLISGYVSLLWYDGFLYLGLRLWKYENIFAKNDILNQTSIISRDGKVFFLSIAKCNVYTHCCHFKFVKQNST